MAVEGINLTPTYFPHQKRGSKEKSTKFFKSCVQAGITLAEWEGSPTSNAGVRPKRKNSQINYDLHADIVDRSEMERVVNPFKIQGATFPAAYRNYPLINPNIAVLVGEERKRIFNPIPIVVNEDATTERVEKTHDKFTEYLVRQLTAESFDEREAEEDLQKLQQWSTYTYKDKRERMAWQVLDYLSRTLDLKETFSRGFEDLLIGAEQIYVVDVYGKEPVVRKGNPLCFSTLRSGDSYKIEDSDIIVEESYLPIGEVIDRYYDDLKSTDITNIEQGYKTNVGAKMKFLTPQLSTKSEDFSSYVESVGIGHILEASKSEQSAFSGSYDSEGNIRVVRVVWRGMRKIKILKYYDEEGLLVKEPISEHYEEDEERGEEVKTLWISEWYEGTRIGEDIYVRMQPREVQMRKMDNLSVGHPGIVGTVINVNSNRGKSMMDYGKPWQYLWNIFMYRTELAFAKSKGKIGKIQAHLIPDGWDMDKWMYYAEIMGWAVEDGFNEGQRGVAQGKLAGSMNQSSPQIDLEMSQYIQNHLMMLDFIQTRADEVTGITRQRKGSIDNRETVGGVERAVMQSSHITEKWFGVHDNTKLRVTEVLLETAKVAWRGRHFKRDYVLDDGTKAILDFDGDVYRESEYGIHISNASSDMETVQALKRLSEVYLQNQGSMSIVADLYRTQNPADLQRKIEKYEEEQKQAEEAMAEREQEMAQMQEQMRMEEIEMEQEFEREKLELESIEKELDRETQILIAEIRASSAKQPEEAPEDNSSAEALASRELSLKERAEENKRKLEDKKLKLEDKKLEHAKQLQKMKEDGADRRERIKAKTAARRKTTSKA